MNEILQWVLIVIAISIPAIIVALINYFLYKKKIAAETENIKAKTKITKEITYDQLKTEGKQKDIKGKIDIFRQLAKLEEEIKNKAEKSAEDRKRLESLEMIKKEFKQSFGEAEKPNLMEGEKKLETKRKMTKQEKK